MLQSLSQARNLNALIFKPFFACVYNIRFFRMFMLMARMAKRNQVFRIIGTRRIVLQVLDVMHLCRLPLPSVPPAVLAHVPVSSKYPRPQSLPACSLVKIIIVVVKCHSFHTAKRTMPPWSAAASVFLLIPIYHAHFQKSRHLTACFTVPDTSGRRTSALLRASGLHDHSCIPWRRRSPRSAHYRCTSSKGA